MGRKKGTKKDIIPEKSVDSLTNKENIDNSIKLAQESTQENMINGSEVFLQSGEDKLELIFNETILFINKHDKLSIKLPASVNFTTINFKFTINRDFSQSKSRIEVNNPFDKNIIDLIFTNWFTDTWIETKPLHYISPNGFFELFIKVRGFTPTDRNLRNLTISIWMKKRR